MSRTAFFTRLVVRCQESYEEEENLTLSDLKKRPQGKKDFSHRSCLHDDITVVIYHFMSDGTTTDIEDYVEVVEAAAQASNTQVRVALAQLAAPLSD